MMVLVVEIICGRRLMTSSCVPYVETPSDSVIFLLKILRAFVVAIGAVVFLMLGDNVRPVMVTELAVV